MKKKVLLVISFVFVLGIGILLGTKFSKSDIYEEENLIPEVTHKEMLSMMLEQTAGEGDYSLETRSSWPTQEEGYVFNSKLSKCEKGSKLRWDDENNLVVMEGTTSDKCYAYFDKYNAITINSSSAVVSGSSVVITIDATAGDGEISKYYYSKDDGLSYIDSTSNTYTFSSLATGTYNIKYYAEDTNGKTSKVVSKEVSVTSVTLASYIKSKYTGVQGDNGLYYHDSSLSNGAGDNSYRYAGSDYLLSSKATDSGLENLNSLVYYYCNGDKEAIGRRCSSDKYNFKLSYNSITYKNFFGAINQALEDGYVTNNINNFVCFGNDSDICPSDNLYRIIGVFGDNVKLIKYDYATPTLLGMDGEYNDSYSHVAELYYYGGSPMGFNTMESIGGYNWGMTDTGAGSSYEATGYHNSWNYSEFNKINLNKNYINNIGKSWANKITEITWMVGGTTTYASASAIYTNEIKNPSTQVPTTYKGKIGLMYISDYEFANDPSVWAISAYSTNSCLKNWMYMGLNEWTITRSTSYSQGAVIISNNGNIEASSSFYDNIDLIYRGLATRPAFYLNSDVTIIGNHQGTLNDPFRID